MIRFSRLLFFSSKHSLSRHPSLRFIQPRTYCKSSGGPRQTKLDDHVYVNPVETRRSRPWPTYLIPVAVFGGLASYVYYNDQQRAFPKGESNRCGCPDGQGPTIGGPFSLFDTDKRVVTHQDLRGNWVLMYFGYTSSPDVGPAQIKVMAKAIDKLESKENLKVLPVFVTLDPQRDNPSHLRAYLKEFDSRIKGLTGPVGAVRQMAQEFRVFFRKIEEDGDDYLVESSHNMYLLNPNMEVAKCFGVEYNPDELSEAILKEIKRASP
ncbi:Thioredoxin superfamily protein [Euphorbia peplus]|nr:Thioredoxin superfamily protein [Euphorbia peplus]